MRFLKHLFFIFLAFNLLSCEDDLAKQIQLKFPDNQTKVQIGSKLNATLFIPKEGTISGEITLQGQKFPINNTRIEIPISTNLLLGKHQLKLDFKFNKEEFRLQKEIEIINNQPPKLMGYSIVNTYPHNAKAYTQGLEFVGDTLYEGTGQYKQSSLRKVDYKTGKVLQKINLPDRVFGEGVSILNGKIYQLTWRSGYGFIYDLTTFEELDKFAFNNSAEGWGLCNDGERFYKSDGTDKIWILEPETMKELSYIQPTTDNGTNKQLNELEWVNGKIYANTYQRDGVAIINPKNGAIDAVIDFRGLRDLINKPADFDPQNHVLNGIAVHPETGNLFVTGKNWDKLFEVEIYEK
ncbi:glutaminyl-peptide cyclotransferase [Psychroflexus salis]|uniref:Glutamine cyclotransferase n=1 Tax=Psychroflexus salis TaxID=1526574 RepID=A0A917E8X8_9FLAO|nr:glutaminyl-peptide cyclotransferase [Psychroflexus salis]GGE14951.1 glutamine cyclotransferase [Psychroflexus salis]